MSTADRIFGFSQAFTNTWDRFFDIFSLESATLVDPAPVQKKADTLILQKIKFYHFKILLGSLLSCSGLLRGNPSPFMD